MHGSGGICFEAFVFVLKNKACCVYIVTPNRKQPFIFNAVNLFRGFKKKYLRGAGKHDKDLARLYLIVKSAIYVRLKRDAVCENY